MRMRTPGQYNLRIKGRQYIQTGGLPQNNLTKHVRFKVMLTVFFYLKGIIMGNWVTDEVPVNQHYDKKVVRSWRPQLWESFIFNQDNKPAHRALSKAVFEPKTHHYTLPLFLFELAQSDFPFPKNLIMRWTHFSQLHR